MRTRKHQVPASEATLYTIVQLWQRQVLAPLSKLTVSLLFERRRGSQSVPSLPLQSIARSPACLHHSVSFANVCTGFYMIYHLRRNRKRWIVQKLVKSHEMQLFFPIIRAARSRKAQLKFPSTQMARKAKPCSESMEEEVLDGTSSNSFHASKIYNMKPVNDGSHEWSIESVLFGDRYQHNINVLIMARWYWSSTIFGGQEWYCSLLDMTFFTHDGQERAILFPTKLIHPMTKAFPRALEITEATKTRSGSSVIRSMVLEKTILVFCGKLQCGCAVGWS